MSNLLSLFFNFLSNSEYTKTLKSVLSRFQDYYNNNKFVRILTICTSTYIAISLSRKGILKASWKYYNLPPFNNTGYPLVGTFLNLFNLNYLKYMSKSSALITVNYIIYFLKIHTIHVHTYKSQD